MIKNIFAVNNKAYNLMYALTLFYAFFGLSFESESRPILILILIILFIHSLIYNRKLFKTIPFFILLAVVGASLITWVLSSIQVPDIAARSPRVGGLLENFTFILLGLILAGSKRKVFVFWGVAVITTVITPWLAGNGMIDIKKAMEGVRTGLGGHIITMGIVYSTVLLSTLVFFKRFVLVSYVKYTITPWLLLVCISAFGVYASQTRAVYLGLVFIYLLSFFSITLFAVKDWVKYRKVFCLFLLVTLFLILGTLVLYKFSYFDFLINKTTKEQSVIWLVISGDFDKVPRNSSGLRIHFWLDVIDWVAQRPLTGWSESANHKLHIAAGNYFGDGYFISVHNDVFEILLSHGLVGLFLHIATLVWMYKRVLRSWKKGLFGNDVFIFFNLFLLFFLINSLFMSLLLFKETLYLWNIVLSGCFGLTINKKLSNI